MKTLYLDCGMGAAGDMLTAALLELLPEPKAFLQELNALGIPGVVTTAVRTEKCGICGTQLSVTVNGAEEESEDVPLAHTHACSHVHEHDHEHEHAHEHPHSHTGMADIRARIAALPVPQLVADDVPGAFQLPQRPADGVHALLADCSQPPRGVIPLVGEGEHHGEQPLGFQGQLPVA